MVDPLSEESKGASRGIFNAVCLGLTFDKVAIESSFQNWRMMANAFLVEDELLGNIIGADQKGDEGFGISMGKLLARGLYFLLGILTYVNIGSRFLFLDDSVVAMAAF